MIYYRGSKTEFIKWEDLCRIEEGIPLDGSGKINKVRGKEKPNNQRTIKYSDYIPNPSDANDVIWNPGDYPEQGHKEITEEEAIGLGFLTPALGV